MSRRQWITPPRIEGTASRQAHADIPPGRYERELGREGFYGPSTQMLHRHPPTAWSSIDGPLRPRAFDSAGIGPTGPSPWDAVDLFGNRHVRIRFWRPRGTMDHLVRNADGDDLLFLHQGGGELYCDYGHLTLAEGDYLLLPRGTQWRIAADGPLALLLIEASDAAYGLPDKGMVGSHAVFDPALLDVPRIDQDFLQQQTEDPWRVLIKRHGRVSTLVYPFNPLDAVGWHGNLMPLRINWRAIRPLMSARYHVPPSAHTTFAAERFVVCTFVPRPLESDPGALKVPFFHSNDDFDEVIFYHAGQFFSRDDIRPGMLTLHPAGIPHGPHPKAFQTGARAARRETDEVAVMIDTRDAVTIGAGAAALELPAYADSWRGSGA